MACATRTEVRRDSRPGIAPGRCAAGRGGGDDGADKRARGRSETGRALCGGCGGRRRQVGQGRQWERARARGVGLSSARAKRLKR